MLIAVIVIAIFLFRTDTKIPNLPFLPSVPQKATIEINSALLKIEIADTQAERSKGLGGHAPLASDEGMLFIFPKAEKYPFWMKGLAFPLDFLWIRDDTVVDRLQNIPPPQSGQPDESLPIYSSRFDANKVLELPAGTIQRLNIKEGDKIKITQ